MSDILFIIKNEKKRRETGGLARYATLGNSLHSINSFQYYRNDNFFL